ncbi:MAG: hypothetical protein QXP39_03030, partial [Candidatus Aenigmatarchaeota archaeon]
VNFTGTCIYTQIRVEARVPPEACANPVILHKDPALSIISTASTVDFSVPPLGSLGVEAGSNVTHSFAVGCLSSPGQGPQDAVKNLLTPWADIIIYYPENKDDKCNCTKQQYDKISQKNKETAEYAQVSCGVKPGDTATVINEDVELKKAPNGDFACNLKKGLQVNVTAMEKIEDKVWFKINSIEQGGILCKKDDKTYTEGWIRELTITTRKCNLDKRGGACIEECKKTSNQYAYCSKNVDVIIPKGMEITLTRNGYGDAGCEALSKNEKTNYNYCWCSSQEIEKAKLQSLGIVPCRQEPGCFKCAFELITEAITGWPWSFCPGYNQVQARYLKQIYDSKTQVRCTEVIQCCESLDEQGRCVRPVNLYMDNALPLGNAVSQCRSKCRERGDYANHCNTQCRIYQDPDVGNALGENGFAVDVTAKDINAEAGWNPCNLHVGQTVAISNEGLCPIYLFNAPGDTASKSRDPIQRGKQVKIVGGPQWGYLGGTNDENIVSWWLVRYDDCVAWYPGETQFNDCCLKA